MKKLYASALLCLAVTSINAQVTFTVLEPASIAGGYDFTSNGDGTNWGLPNLLNPLDAVQDTLMLVDDGTPGVNAQGVPFANEGCGPLVNDLTGKIAVVYRYDGVSANVCWYGTKVLNAQNAGAVGVIMINREDALIDVPGTTDGPLTSIPFAFISKSDGEILRARMDAGDDVVAFIGNKLGLYADDCGISKPTTLSPSIAAIPSLLAQDNTEFGFDVGAQIYNYGSNDQANVNITATVDGPAGTWTQTAGPFSILAGDSIDVYTGGTNDIPAFSFPTYPDGRYTLTYDVNIGTTDEMDFDNSLSYDFVVSDSLYTYSYLDAANNLPKATVNYRPGNGSVTFNTCQVFDNPNGSRIALDGIYFSAVTGYNSGVTLDGEEIELSVYSWDDAFVDLNDAGLLFDNLSSVGFGYYYYPTDLQAEVVYGALDFPVQLSDNQRYLACVSSSNTDVYLGFDKKIDYDRHINHYLQPLSPIAADDGWYALGFGTDLTPATALHVFDAALLGIESIEKWNVSIFPNPATDELSINLGEHGVGDAVITDLLGREVISTRLHTIVSTLDISTLTNGQYLLNVTTDQGETSSVKFIKR